MQDGEPQTKRRVRTGMGGQNSISLPPASRSASKTNPVTQTDTYQVDEGLIDQRSGSSAVRFDQTSPTLSQRPIRPQVTSSTIPQRRQQTLTQGITRDREMPRPRLTGPRPQPMKVEKKVARKHFRMHWLFLVGVGMIAALVLWLLATSVLAWSMQRYDDIRYGMPRTSHTDWVVGHNDSPAHPSHFIAVNQNHQAIVIEFMGGDPGKSEIYVAPVTIEGDNSNLVPITVDFKDVTGDNKVDMIIHIHLLNKPEQISVFVNTGTKFRPSDGNDRLHV